MRALKFYTLFYVDFQHHSLSGNLGGSFHEQMKAFIGCCGILDQSLRLNANSSLTVLTNSREYLEKVNPNLNCAEIEFKQQIPRNIGFFASHFKLDVYSYLAGLQDGGYYFLIDSDVVCLNPMPQNMVNCIHSNIPMYYDITKQYYPAYGRDVMLKAKEILAQGKPSTGFWIGGEFLAGDNLFFDELAREIALIMPLYLDNYKVFFHQSDETLVSVALEKMMASRRIVNVGDFGGIGKFWSCPTKHEQSPVEAFADHFLLHLPADKNYLGNLKSFSPLFFKRYKRRLRRRRIFPVHMVRPVLGRLYHRLTGKKR